MQLSLLLLHVWDETYPWALCLPLLCVEMCHMYAYKNIATASSVLCACVYLSQEMRGLCVIMAPNDQDPHKYFSRAYESYTRLQGPWPRLLATRVALLASQYHVAAGRLLLASATLSRPHQEVNDCMWCCWRWYGMLTELSVYMLCPAFQ